MKTQHTTATLLSVDQTDELARNHRRIEDGAIEDAEVSDSAVAYFYTFTPSRGLRRRTMPVVSS